MTFFRTAYRKVFLIYLLTPVFLFSISSYGQTESTAAQDSLSVSSAWGWTFHSFDYRLLQALPDREVKSFPLLVPGMTDLNGNLYARGSRAGEIAYFLNGISVTNPFFNSNGVPLIAEAVEKLDIHTGAYGAQFGGANGGLVLSTMRKGGEAFEFGASVETDDFASPGERFIGASPNGYRRLVATAGGSLLGTRFFAAAQHRYLHNRQPMFLEPFLFDNLTTDEFNFYYPQGTPLPGPVEFKRNYLFNNWLMENAVQGNVSFPVGPFEIRAIGSYAFEESPQGSEWPSVLENYFHQRRNMRNESKTFFGALQVSHHLFPTTFYTLTFSAYDRYARLYDPDFGDEWMLYSDSVAFYQKSLVQSDGSTGFRGRYLAPISYSTISNFRFIHPNAPNNRYRKDRQTSFSLAVDLTSEIIPTWTITAGGKIDWWTMREYNVTNISSYMFNVYGPDGSQTPTYSDEYEQRIFSIRSGNIDNYGYDYEGNIADEGFDAPREPQFSSLYMNNSITDDGLTLNIGARYEALFSGATMFPNYDPQTPEEFQTYYDDNNNTLKEETMVERNTIGLFLPRVSLSYYQLKGLSWFASYGKYAQYAPLDNFLLGSVPLGRYLSPYTRSHYWLSGYLPGFFADPERSTHYEVGGKFTLLDRLPISVRLYYKSLTSQLQLGKVRNAQGEALFVALLNQGEGVTKGFELSVELAHTRNVTLLTHYAYSDARGRTSHPLWNRRDVSDIYSNESFNQLDPEYLIPFDYDRAHRVDALLQYRHEDPSSTLLDGLGFTAVLTVQSGHRYTKQREIQNLGAASPWNIGVRTLLDSRVAQFEEPYNGSRTPLYFNLDLRASKVFILGGVRTEFFVTVFNALNTKHVLNVYPTTGTPNDDSWLRTRFATNFIARPNYTEFYTAINLQNGWGYSSATGNSIYGKPLQIRAGIRLDI